MARTRRRTHLVHCPSCHHDVRPTPILWGLPAPEGVEAAERGEVVLGGCLVSHFDPSHVCPECDAQLYEMPDGAFEIWMPTGLFPASWRVDGPLPH